MPSRGGGDTVLSVNDLPVKIGDLSLSWSDFVDAVKNPNHNVTQEQVAEAYQAYKDAGKAVAESESEYEEAKQKYDKDAEKQLQTWQSSLTTKNSELSVLNNTLTVKNNVVVTLENEISTLNTTISTNETTLKNWPQVEVSRTAKAELATVQGYLDQLASRVKSGGLLWSYQYTNTTDSSDKRNYVLVDGTFPSTASGIKNAYNFTYKAASFSDVVSYYVKDSGIYRIVLFCVPYAYLNENQYVTVPAEISTPTASEFETAIADLKTELTNSDYSYNITYKDAATFNGWSSKTTLSNKIAEDKKTLTTKQGELATAKSEQETAQTNYNNKKAEVETLQAQIDSYTALKNLYDEKSQAYEKAKSDEAAAEKALAEALENLNNGLQDNPYLNVELTADVVADVPLGKYSGNIKGNGHSITAGQGVEKIFPDFSGTLTDAAVNGNLTGFEAKVHNVAFWDGVNNGAYYDELGTKTTYHDFGELAYSVRKNFAADFENATLIGLDDSTKDKKVYDLTLITGPGSEQNHRGYYQLTADGRLINAKNEQVTVPANHFIYSATPDVNDITVANVYYGTEEGYHSNYVVVDLNATDFYCPVDLTAKEIEVKGDITAKEGKGTICLPFALRPDYFDSATSVCTFNRDNGSSFRFTRVETEVPANTPVLLFCPTEQSKIDINIPGAVHIQKTPAGQIVSCGYDQTGNSQSYGTYKAVTAGEIGQLESEDCVVYALKNGVFTGALQGDFSDGSSHDFVNGYDNVAKFKPFRMAIASKKHYGNSPTMAPRRIIITDEEGDVLSGAEYILATDGSLDVIGEEGRIRITSESDFGPVEIYDLTGRTAATADVKAGETTVSLTKGIYLVAGTKVIVK